MTDFPDRPGLETFDDFGAWSWAARRLGTVYDLEPDIRGDSSLADAVLLFSGCTREIGRWNGQRGTIWFP